MRDYRIRLLNSLRTVAVLFVAGVMFVCPAWADLMVTPKRVILDDGASSGILRLLNQSREARSYEVVWNQLRMDQQGGLTLDPNPNAPGNSSSLVSVTPRRVSLQPGESQTVRVRARTPNGLPVGEYISHLAFRPIGDSARSSSASGQSGASLMINMRLGIAIPIIVRHGALSATASLQPLALNLKEKHLLLRINREGGASIYGNIEAYWGQAGAKGTLIAQLNGFAVYPNLSQVERKIPLTVSGGTALKDGLMHVLLRDPVAGNAIAQTTVRLE